MPTLLEQAEVAEEPGSLEVSSWVVEHQSKYFDVSLDQERSCILLRIALVVESLVYSPLHLADIRSSPIK